MPVFFRNSRDRVKDFISRLGTKWTRVDPTITTGKDLTLHPRDHEMSRCPVLLEDDFPADDFTAINLLDLVDRNCAIGNTLYTGERATKSCTEQV